MSTKDMHHSHDVCYVVIWCSVHAVIYGEDQQYVVVS